MLISIGVIDDTKSRELFVHVAFVRSLYYQCKVRFVMKVVLRNMTVFIVGLAAISYCVTFVWAGGCEDEGSIETGCGSGENGCVGSEQSNCEGDDAKVLASGLFGCGTDEGKQDCVNSSSDKELCYTEYECEFDDSAAPQCHKDEDTADEHEDWIKTDWGC